MVRVVCFALLFTVVTLSLAVDQYKIGAFNVQVFGQTKAKKVEVMKVLEKIIPRYHLILIQEIRDTQGTAFPMLMNQINDADLKYIQSKRLGRSSSKEQYAFVYNTRILSLVMTYQYPDNEDVFERPPFCAYFAVNNPGTALSAFGACGIHIKPSDAVNEMNHLPELYDAAVLEFGSKDIMIMGDFNADCNYVKKSDWPRISLWTDKNFIWEITESVDSTVAESSCAYDRIVVAGEHLKRAVVKSGVVYRFDQTYKLSHDQTKDVSDHFPVEVNLFKDVPFHTSQRVAVKISSTSPPGKMPDCTRPSIGSFAVLDTVHGCILSASVTSSEIGTSLDELLLKDHVSEAIVDDAKDHEGLFGTASITSHPWIIRIEYEKAEPHLYSVTIENNL